VALASVDVYFVVGVFAVAVDNVFTVGYVVCFKWLIRLKAVGIDGERLLLANRQQESNHRFICGFRWN